MGRIGAGRTLLAVAAVGALAGCSGSTLSWTLTFDGNTSLSSRATHVYAEVREGACSTRGAVRYTADLVGASTMAGAVGDLGGGTYAFSGEAVDATCTVYASGCQTVHVPEDRAIPIVVHLVAAMPTSSCRCAGSCPDAGSTDLGLVDGSRGDGGDAGSPIDSGGVDSGGIDSGVVDSGDVDSGVVDSGDVDSGAVDAGVDSGGGVDAGPHVQPTGVPTTFATPYGDATLGDVIVGVTATGDDWLLNTGTSASGTWSLRACLSGGTGCTDVVTSAAHPSHGVDEADLIRPGEARGNGLPSAIVLRMRSLTVPDGAIIEISGARYVILWVEGDVQIDGTIAVYTDSNGNLWGDAFDGSSTGTPSGGGGGGYCTGGGHGGAGTAAGGVGGAGGRMALDTLGMLRAGQSGGSGGAAGGVAAYSGDGALPLQIVANGTIRVGATGVVSSCGDGGGPGSTVGTTHGGGGGGGTGGAIMLEASTIQIGVGGRVGANGGGGGAPAPGIDSGDTGSPSVVPAPGGVFGTSIGGAGSDADGFAAGGVNSAGGGGGAGWILLHADTITSPDAAAITPSMTSGCLLMGPVVRR